MSSQNNTQNITNVETQVKESVQNINIDLSKIDMSKAIDSFKRLEEITKSANFDGFLDKIVELKKSFTGFQNSVRSAGTETKNFIELPKNLQGIQVNNEIDNSVNVDLASLDTVVANLGSTFQSLSGPITSIGQVFSNVTGTIQSFGQAFIDIGSGIDIACGSVANLFNSFQSLGNGMIGISNSVAILVPQLPGLGTAMLVMAANMSGITAYIPDLLVFLGVLLALSLLGEGLQLAGNGLVNIGLGLTSITMGMAALLEFMPLFIASLAGITENIGGIILFVLLAASMLVMAVALQTMNEQMTQFVSNMQILANLMSVGFVAAFVVFGAMLIGMSLFMDKVASGLDKITQAMGKQITKLAILNPLLAVQAVLSNPFVGAVTVALAVASGILVKALLPAMATGGVVSDPTVAMVGEGRYPEAVIPLGDSPQFASMKADIANAVIQGISALGGVSGSKRNMPKNLTVQLQIDGRQFAETTVRDFVETLNNEGYGVVRSDAMLR